MKEVHQIQEIKNILACPTCRSDLNLEGDKLLCTSCGKKYLIHNGVPIFHGEEKIKESAVESHVEKGGNSLKKVFSLLKPPHHSVYIDTLESSYNDGRELVKFLADFKEDDVVVNVGSLSKKINSGKVKLLNLDLSFYPNIDIVGDAHHLPFKNESLDGIVIKNVFEHLRDPAVVRKEMYRVLKKGARFYAKVPFMQPFHAVPDDYQRFTTNGLNEFFKDFKQIEKGISVGPSSALAWFLREYLGVLFSFNTDKGYKIARAFFSYLTAPIKYFDFFFRKKKEAHRLASAFYIIMEK